MVRWHAPFTFGAILSLVLALSACSGGGGTPSSGTSGGGTPVASPTAGQSSTNDLANPIEVDSVNGVASVTLTAMINPATGGPAISYNGAIVLPTIRVSPGDTIDVTYVNALPASSVEPYNDASLHFSRTLGFP
jgi:FtsP/CotA-like multicopper oxidase with cupredoxin domain